MKRRFLFVFTLAAVLVTSAIAFSRYAKGNAQTQPQNTEVITPEPRPLPDTVLYKHLFHHYELLDKKAAEEEKLGKDGKIYREFYKRQAKLTDAQAKDLDRIAKETEKEVTRITSQAQEIIHAIRSRYPNGKVTIGQKVPPPPPILADLQEQHDVALEQGRDKLKEAWGESDFAKFDGFLRSFMGTDMKSSHKIERVPPANSLGRPKERK